MQRYDFRWGHSCPHLFFIEKNISENFKYSIDILAFACYNNTRKAEAKPPTKGSEERGRNDFPADGSAD